MTTTTVDPLLALTSMTADGCLPCQERQRQERHASAAPEEAPTNTGWSGVIGVEGEMTGDGRLIEKNALRWEGLPLPLRYVSSDVGAHDGAVVVGRISSISRADDGTITGEGDFDMSSEAGREAARQVGEGLTNGISMDLDDVSFEVRVASELMEEITADPFLMLMGGDDEDAEAPPPPEPDADGRVKVMEINADDEVRVTTDGRIRAATIVAIPAFSSAKIALTGETVPVEETEEDEPDGLVAAAPPVAPPVAWFSRPHLTGPTPLTVTEDGRVYGHMAVWGTCHASHTQAGQCVPPPHSATNYAHFNTGAVLTAEGAEVVAGRITMDTRHAGERLSPAATIAHYEDTGTVVADVVAGEDSHGIWIAGALRPGATPEQIRALRASPLSGDWRRVGSALELHAALAVNVPGFLVPRPQGLVAGGVVKSLVASGMLPPRKVRRPGSPGALSTDDLRYLKRLADRERAEESLRAAGGGKLPEATELARRVRASVLRVQRFDQER